MPSDAMTSLTGFQLFGSIHLTTLALITFAAVVLPLAVRLVWPSAARPVALTLAGLLLAQEAAQVVFILDRHGWSPVLLPLHLCTLAVYLTAWMLVTGQQRVFEVVYFWGLGGTTQALLTPELARTFPSPEFLLFFLGHGLVIIGVLYGAIVYRLRPVPMSIVRVAALTLALAGAVVIVNLWLGTNFMYLMEKPARASLLDWLGPWPWYWLSLIGIALLTFLVFYSPYFIADRFRQSRARRRR